MNEEQIRPSQYRLSNSHDGGSYPAVPKSEYFQDRQEHYPSDSRAEQYDRSLQKRIEQCPQFQYQHPSLSAYPCPPPISNDSQYPQPPPDPHYMHSRFPDLDYPFPRPCHYEAPRPIPRQRAAIACNYCRKRKIRCSGFEESPDGRCQNCSRLGKRCLFHSISSRGVFVPISALYGPASHSTANRNQQGFLCRQRDECASDGEPIVLYGAHGQPLRPVVQIDISSSTLRRTPLDHHYQTHFNGVSPPHLPDPRTRYADGDQGYSQPDQEMGRKRYSPKHHNSDETFRLSQSPHTKRQQKSHESHEEAIGSRHGDADHMNIPRSSAAASTTNKQSDLSIHLSSDHSQIQEPGQDLQTARSAKFPSKVPIRNNDRTPPRGERSSAQPDRCGMSVRDMLGRFSPTVANPEQRGREDNEKPDMLHRKEG